MLGEVTLKKHRASLPYGNIDVKGFCQMALPIGEEYSKFPGMSLPRVRAVRESLGLSIETVAHDIGISTSQLSRIETGEREARVGEAKRLSARLNIPLLELLGEQAQERCPVVGLVSAGSDEIIFSLGQGPLDYVDPPDDASEDTVAVEIRGNSLGAIFDGWLVFYDDIKRPPIAQMMNRICVAELDDGRVVVKRISQGQRRDRYNLASNVSPPIYDAKIAWAARVIAMKPR